MSHKEKVYKKNSDSHQKLEIAKSIAKSSKKISKTYLTFESSLARSLKFLSDKIDQFVLNPKLSGVVALILTLILYFSINIGIGETLFVPAKNAETINNVSVTAIANNEIYEVSGLDETVSITIVGDMQDVQMAKIQGGFKVVADLSGLSEGTHQINYTPVNFPKGVKVIVEPSNAVVTIEKKVSWTFNLGYEYINLDKMDSKYILDPPVLETNEVNVRASQKVIDSISFVKALIDVSNVKGDFEAEATIVAFDQAGNKLDVDILPNKIKAKVYVTSPSKVVPIIIEPKGIIPNNKAIDRIILDHEAVTIYAPEEVLNTIDSIVIPIDVTELKGDTKQITPVYLPQGVRKSSISKVSYEIKLTDAATKIIDKVPIKYKNNVNGYKPNVSQENAYVQIEITGAKDRIDKITAEDIDVWIDLSAVKVGKQELEVKVRGFDVLITYKTLVDKIPVEISK